MAFVFNGRQRNFLFLIVLGLTLVFVSSALIIGHRQDQVFRANYEIYQQAIALMGEKKYDLALQSFQALDTDSQATYQVLYMSAFCESQIGDYAAAAQHMQMAREARPALVQDPKFLQRYGVILFNLGDYPQAALYLNESLKYPSDKTATQEAQDYLEKIMQKQTEGR